MEPDQNKRKRILAIVLIFILLTTATFTTFIIFEYNAELKKSEPKKQTNSIAYINTFNLPEAKVGVVYQAEVFVTLTDAHEDLMISATGLPDGLTLGKCTQEFDSNLISIPNTLTKCVIEGIPAKDGFYQIKVSATNKNNSGYHTVEQTVDLVVVTSQI